MVIVCYQKLRIHCFRLIRPDLCIAPYLILDTYTTDYLELSSCIQNQQMSQIATFRRRYDVSDDFHFANSYGTLVRYLFIHLSRLAPCFSLHFAIVFSYSCYASIHFIQSNQLLTCSECVSSICCYNSVLVA